jgi:hypothetical protein
MGRYGYYPTTINDLKTLSITKLNKWNYLTNGYKTGTIDWSTNGIKTSSISISVCINDANKYIELNYNWNNEKITYKVFIVEVGSNLGKGTIKYFVCPRTNKQCRKLYLNNGYFLHRTAFSGLYYENQIESKKNRDLIKVFEKVFLPDSVLEARYKKYFKTHYKGKPTKKYLKLQPKIDLANSFPAGTLENLMLL